MIKVENLHLSYNNQETEVLKGITFSVDKGKITGLIGHNGAGKTTIIKLICGLLSPTSYTEFKVLDRDIKEINQTRNIGLIIGVDQLYDDLTAYENIIYYLKLNNVKKDKQQIDQMLDKVELLDVKKKKVSCFSTGMKQKLNIAKVLLCDKNVIILDEPTAGMDPLSKKEITQLLLSIARKDNITILISSHSMNEVEKLCDNVIFINEGYILYSGQTKLLFKKYDKKVREIILNHKDGKKLVDELKKNHIRYFCLEQDDNTQIVIFDSSCKIRLDGEKCDKVIFRDLVLEDIYFHQIMGGN